MDDTGERLGSGYFTSKLPASKDMPWSHTLPRQSLDDSNLVLRRRPVERSGSCLRFTSLENPSIGNITSENISNKSHKNEAALRSDHPNYLVQDLHGSCQTSIKRPHKNALGVSSHTRARILSVAEQESSAATKPKADHESLQKKKKHEKKTGTSSSISKGLHSKTGKFRPAFRMNHVVDTEALESGERMLGSELLMSKTTCERNSDYTIFKAKELNKSLSKAYMPTEERKVDHDTQRLDGRSVLVNSHTKRIAKSDDSYSIRSSSFEPKTGFTDAGSSLKDKITSKSMYPGLLDFEEPINGRETRHMQRSTRAQSVVDTREESVASGVQFQRSRYGTSAKAFRHKYSFSENPLYSTRIKQSQGESASQQLQLIELQRSHAAIDSKGSALPAEVDHSIKPHLLVELMESLVRTLVILLRICSKRGRMLSASFIQDNSFVTSSFVIKCRSWITSVSLALLILSFSCSMLKIQFLKVEVTRLHGLLDNCTIASLDISPKSFIDEQPFQKDPGVEFEDMFTKHSSKVALPVIILFVPFLLKKKTIQLQEMSRKYIMGNEEDAPIGKRLAYGVDILFSTRPYMKATALLLATILLICGGGVALFAVTDDSLADAMWRAWTYVADSGNHADSEGTWPRIVSLLISFGGMLIFALMLGLISDAISEKVDSLRKGKSEVIESGHTLILGWSDKLGSLLKQLAIANQSLGGGVVVVLAERNKEEMELDIAKLEFNFMGTSVICRSGSPLIMADLKKVSVSKARAIIVLAEIDNADQSDARALRVVLSLNGIKEGLNGHIVVEMRDLDNEALVKLVGGQMVETVVAHDVIGRLMIQCARQPGLAQIWEDILGFEKAEFYIKRWPELDGQCFGDALISFPEAIPCGIKMHNEGGRIFINPDDDYVLCEGDEILVIAEDDDTYAPAPLPQVREPPLLQAKRSQKKPQKILLCGWRRDIEDMIMVLDAFLAPGSELWIFSDVPECDREKKLLYGNLNPNNLDNIQLVHREGNTVIRRHLESLPLEDFDSILILADEKLEDTVVNADSSSLATLLLIRDIQSKRLPLEVLKGSQNKGQAHSQSSWIREMHEASNKTIIISEILDSRTKNLVSVSKISDYVLSNELVSMALAMVAEDKQINRVLEELFAEEGNELYIRPAEFYLYDQEEVSFFEIMIRARQRDEIVIGYRKALADHAVINPPDKNALQKWSLQDTFVVLAFEE